MRMKSATAFCHAVTMTYKIQDTDFSHVLNAVISDEKMCQQQCAGRQETKHTAAKQLE